MQVLYEDNHVLIVAKAAGEIVQGDKTGDRTLADEAKAYIKAKYKKPGDVFLGIPHRLDRPVSGICVLARTSKALSRLNEMFREGKVEKVYHAIVCHPPRNPKGTLTHYLTRNEKQNKSYASLHEKPQSKKAVLDYQLLTLSKRYALVEVHLHTGRHHQIRCQLAAIGAVIKGDLKYGAPRSNPDGSICLHARRIAFTHPIGKTPIVIEAPYPSLAIWQAFEK